MSRRRAHGLLGPTSGAPYARGVKWLVPATVRHHAAAAWRRYLRLRRVIRWPTTAAALIVLAVLASNLVFGSVARSARQEFLIPPGETESMEVQVDAGRNVDVTWEPAGALADAPVPLDVTLTGPDLSLAGDQPAAQGRLSFKGGFTRNLYRLRLSNAGGDQTARVVVRWTIR